MQKFLFSGIIVLFIITLFPTAISESQYNIPDWVRNIGGMYFDGAIDSASFATAIEWLINNEIITVTLSESSTTNSASYHTFSNSTGAYLTNSTGTSLILDRNSTFTNSTGAYLTNSTGTFVVLDRNQYHTFSNSTGAYLTNSTGTYKISP